jgi:hypothetical protein
MRPPSRSHRPLILTVYAELESVILGEALRICFPTFSALCAVQFRIVRGKLVLSAGEDQGRVLGHSNPLPKSLCPGPRGFDKTPISCDFFFLTYNSLLPIFTWFQTEFKSNTSLTYVVKPGEVGQYLHCLDFYCILNRPL